MALMPMLCQGLPGRPAESVFYTSFPKFCELAADSFPFVYLASFDYKTFWGERMDHTQGLASWGLCSLFRYN